MKRLLLAFLAMGLVASAGQAQNIGFNFNADREDAALASDEVAGVVPQGNWNNWDGILSSVTENETGDASEIASPNAGVVTDSDGNTHPGVTVSWESRNAWNTTNGVGTPDNKLMNGYIDNNADNPQITFSISGLPAAIADTGYDVYAYIGSDGNGRTGTITDGTTTYSYSTFSAQDGAFPGAYAQTTDTADGNPEANYAVFSGLTGSDFTLTLDRGSNNSGIHGIQIVTIPEPSCLTMGLIATLMGAGILRRRR